MKVLNCPPRLSPRKENNITRFLAQNMSAGKSARDALRVWRDARGYIALDEHGAVSDWHIQPAGNLPVIAVVAPLEFGFGVVLEIGLNRTTPYRPVEGSAKDKTSFIIPERKRARGMSEVEFRFAFPVIETILEYLLIHQRSGWIHKEEWWVGGLSEPVFRGIGIRVSTGDEFLYRQMLLEDIRLRAKRIGKLTRSIHYWLRRFKHSSGYSERFLRSMPSAGRVAEALSWQRDVSLHLVVAARRSLGAYSHSHTWVLCEEIMNAFHTKRADEEACRAMHEFLYGKVPKFPHFSSMSVRLEAERSGKFRHGQGCITLEVIPTEKLARAVPPEDHNIPF